MNVCLTGLAGVVRSGGGSNIDNCARFEIYVKVVIGGWHHLNLQLKRAPYKRSFSGEVWVIELPALARINTDFVLTRTSFYTVRAVSKSH